jgi:hypothetical protein
MSVKQFSAVYSPLEDRIIFSFNTTEGELYSFVLTRAITASLLDYGELVVEQSLSSQHNERSSKLISEFQKAGLKKQINFAEAFEGGDTTPLGKDPILVSQISLDLKPNTVGVSLTLVSNQIIGFQIAAVQLQALSLLLEKLARQANWKITLEDHSGPDLLLDANESPISQLH